MLQPNLFLFRKKTYGFGNISSCAEHTCSFFISSLSKIAPASVFLPPPSHFPDWRSVFRKVSKPLGVVSGWFFFKSFFIYLETSSHIAPASLNFTVQLRLSLNS